MEAIWLGCNLLLIDFLYNNGPVDLKLELTIWCLSLALIKRGIVFLLLVS